MDPIIDVDVVRREWPKPGHYLYSVVTEERNDLYMSYVECPGSDFDCAILMSIDPKKNTCTVLRIEKVADEQAAIKWYVGEWHTRRAN